jgi:photosynthetic reaction center cytochrome c subunit
MNARFASLTLAVLATSLLAVAGRTNAPRIAAPRQATPQSNSANESKPAGETRTAGEVYKNVHVLKDVPAGELIPAMRYITVALGVRCNFCHVMGHFDSDQRRPKQTARKMMQMLFAINRENFDGHPVVSCNTCHHGAREPMRVPPLWGETAALSPQPGPGPTAQSMPPNSVGGAPPGAAGEPGGGQGAGSRGPMQSGPSVANILDRYLQAVGGTAAIANIHTLTESGSVAVSEGPMHFQAPAQVVRELPGKVAIVLSTPMGRNSSGTDGAVAWEANPREVAQLSGGQKGRLQRWAELFPGLDLQGNSRARETGAARVGNRDGWQVVVFGAGGPERLIFDGQSGLLLQRYAIVQTVLGGLPESTTFDDYRDVEGVKVPATVRITGADGGEVYTFTEIAANHPLAPDSFTMPPQPAGAGGKQ